MKWNRFRVWPFLMLFGLGSGNAIHAQTSATISLAQAQEIAVRNHPRIAAATLTAQAGQSVVNEVRSAYSPTLSANLTAVGAESDATLSAGAVTTSSLYNRAASGIVATQLLTDFGRTASLEQSARLRNAAQNQNVSYTRAQVLLEVQQAYYQALAAESVLKVEQATLDLRRLTLRQITALSQSALRSTLDVSFAQVNVSEAELALSRAENDDRATHARLSAALGYAQDQPFSLADEPLPPNLSRDVDGLIAQALHDRPDLAALRLNHEALESTAEAEKRLRNPTVTAMAVGGDAPFRDDKIRGTYGAAGINVNVPVLNGGLFKARATEAEARAAAADKDVQAISLAIARDVKVAWLDANDAFHRLDVTSRLVAQADEALRLAQARYDAGLGSIVELNQAQLNQTSARIAAASAKYEYLSKGASLNYEDGTLR
jgi:outer membrane protein